MNESKNHEWQLCLAFDCFLLLSHTLLLNHANILHLSIAKEQGETEYISASIVWIQQFPILKFNDSDQKCHFGNYCIQTMEALC